MLSEVADAAHVRGLAHVGDDELTGIIKAWRRITSWGAARELAAVAELARRRPADIGEVLDPEVAAQLRAAGGAAAAGSASPGLPGSTESPAGPGLPELVSPFVPDELVPALTMTVRAAELHLSLAADLATKLPMTAAALEAGLIDMVRARIIAEAARVLTRERAAAVEQLIFPEPNSRPAGSCVPRWPGRSWLLTPMRRASAGSRPSGRPACCAGGRTRGQRRCPAVTCRRRKSWLLTSASRPGHGS